MRKYRLYELPEVGRRGAEVGDGYDTFEPGWAAGQHAAHTREGAFILIAPSGRSAARFNAHKIMQPAAFDAVDALGANLMTGDRDIFKNRGR